jgi:hypothetical protein
MSGFRRFRSTLHRRRRSIEAVELGYLTTGAAPTLAGTSEGPGAITEEQLADAEGGPLEFSPSLEAREIGPSPIAWTRPKRETDN